MPALDAGRPIRDESLDADEEKALRGFRFLTQKPVLVLLNVGENDLPREPALIGTSGTRYDHRHAMVDALSAKIEMELGELEPDEAAVFMEELGLHESALDRVIGLSYRLLGLISFLTAGPDEVRAWPIPDGSNGGRRRGGHPHRPRARSSSAPRSSPTRTCWRWAPWRRRRSTARLRSEGKTYHVRDGDVIEILFSR